MQLREIKVKKGTQLLFIVNDYGDLILQNECRFSCLKPKSSREPLSPIKRSLLDIQLGGKVQVKSNKPSLSSMSCRCKKSKCLKYYCDCYSDGRECGKQCVCTGCQNTHAQRQVSVEAKKVSGLEKSCFCEKSNCLKNYCVCHAAGRKCSSACKCKICKNQGIESDEQEVKEENESPRESRQFSMRYVEYPFPLRDFQQWELCSSPFRRNETI